MQEPFRAQRLELPEQLGRAQGLRHGAHQVELDTDRRESGDSVSHARHRAATRMRMGAVGRLRRLDRQTFPPCSRPPPRPPPPTSSLSSKALPPGTPEASHKAISTLCWEFPARLAEEIVKAPNTEVMNKKAKVPKQEAKSRGHIKSGMRIRGNVPEGQEGVERARRGKGRTDQNYVFKSPPNFIFRKDDF